MGTTVCGEGEMKRSLVLVCALAASGLAKNAQSQPASAEADLLFDQARTLMDQGKYADACMAFDASQKLSPAVSTLFNQANCREKNQQFATAYGLWREAERKTRTPIDEQTQKLNRIAVEHWKALEPKLSKLTIVVADENRMPGLEIARDKLALDVGMWNHALPSDGGTFTITAHAPDREPWAMTIHVANEGDQKTVEVPPLKLAPKPVMTSKPEPMISSQPRTGIVPWIVAGGTVALVSTAVGFELSSRSTYGKSKREPDDARQESLWEDAKKMHYAAQGLAIAGIACAGVATWLFLRSHDEEAMTTRTTKLNIALVLTTESTGFLLATRF